MRSTLPVWTPAPGGGLQRLACLARISPRRHARSGGSFARRPAHHHPVHTDHRGGVQVFVPACGDQASVVVEHATSAGWAPYVSGFCLAALAAAPIPLAAGGTLTGSVSIPARQAAIGSDLASPSISAARRSSARHPHLSRCRSWRPPQAAGIPRNTSTPRVTSCPDGSWKTWRSNSGTTARR